MKNIPGSMGTCASIALRLGQAICSSVSILFMSLGVGFYSYTAFCFLVTIMGLVIPWSFTLALLDGYSILAKFPIHQSGMLQVIILGDLVIPNLGSTNKDMIIHDVTKFDVHRLLGQSGKCLTGTKRSAKAIRSNGEMENIQEIHIIQIEATSPHLT
ncbi:CASP-like protein 5C1 [Sesamum angolense]|uniref:CASP-like protein n=1 Tax=Sesamum angolense TaxID=2727404 RepID=A0AAE1X4S8_9LAMI|nr:CASP-like protein 5C1 [Sesamum angolense]